FCIVSSGLSSTLYLLAPITEWRGIVVSPSITQSFTSFLSKRHSLQIQPVCPSSVFLISPHWSLRAVTRSTSSPRFHKVTLPQHLSQSRCASSGLVNQTRFLKRKVLSVKAP